MAKIAIVRIHGQVRNNGKRHTAMKLLGINKKFSVIVKDDSPAIKSQLKTINPDITWGEASDDVILGLAKKFPGQKVYRLCPPKGGLGRKGIKISYRQKGAFGYRGAKINDLIKKMI